MFTDRLWAVTSVVSGLIALNGAVLAVAGLFDGSPIPLSVGLVASVLGTVASRAAWRRTVWAARTRATGIGYLEQQCARDLRPREVLAQRGLLIGAPIAGIAFVVATDLPWLAALPLLVVVPVLIVQMPSHQRRQLRGRA